MSEIEMMDDNEVESVFEEYGRYGHLSPMERLGFISKALDLDISPSRKLALMSALTAPRDDGGIYLCPQCDRRVTPTRRIIQTRDDFLDYMRSQKAYHLNTVMHELNSAMMLSGNELVVASKAFAFLRYVDVWISGYWELVVGIRSDWVKFLTNFGLTLEKKLRDVELADRNFDRFDPEIHDTYIEALSLLDEMNTFAIYLCELVVKESQIEQNSAFENISYQDMQSRTLGRL